jgi:hypothetical protein
MDENISRQILDDLLPSLEALDTKASALLQLLKDKGIATPEEITAHLNQAANSSNIRWRAARVRLDYLLSAAAKPHEQAADKKAENKVEAAEKKSIEPADTGKPDSQAIKEGETKTKTKEDQKKTNPETSGAKAPSAEKSADTKQNSETHQEKETQQPKENPSPAPTAVKEEREAEKETDNKKKDPTDPTNKAA